MSSPPRRQVPTPSPEFNPDSTGHVVYVSFRHREPGSDAGSSNWIECYYPDSNTWSHVSHVPNLRENHVLKGFAMVALGERIYIVGGQSCQGKADGSREPDDLVYEGVEVSPLVLCYDVRSDRWSDCAPLGVPRYDFACTVCNGKIYVAGGKSNLASARGISSAEVYDPEANTWTRLPKMSTVRYKCVGVMWKGKIHVVGGFAEEETEEADVEFNMLKGMRERSSAEVYDTRTGKWDLVAGMWQLDVPPNQIVDVNDKLFSSGDCLKPWKGHIEAYNGKLWDEVAGSRYQINSQLSDFGSNTETWPEFERLYLTMAPVGNYLYFLAGYRMGGEAKTLSKVYIFDTTARTHAWRSYEPAEEEGEKELGSHCCVVQSS